jgi:hypothetical protein
LINLYQWSTAKRRKYNRQTSSNGGISSPTDASHKGLVTRTEPSGFKRSTKGDPKNKISSRVFICLVGYRGSRACHQLSQMTEAAR